MRTYGKTAVDKYAPQKLSPVQIVILAFGGATKLAKILNITPQAVCNWAYKGKYVPAKYRQEIAFYVSQHPEIHVDGKYIWARNDDYNSETIPTEGY